MHVNTLIAELSPVRHLLALVGDRHIVHVSRVRVNILEVTDALSESKINQKVFFKKLNFIDFFLR